MKTDHIRVYGIVQGVGFRPFVSRICMDNGIRGTVANRGSYVEIYAQGEDVATLYDALRHTPPDRAVILNIITKYVDLPPFDGFDIINSTKDEGEIFVSPDIAICEQCKEELFDKTNRRYMHPFINCTNCGPRLTILEAMPYDRERTSMKEFKMCPECGYEYTHAETRRYDAQPVCCPNCGPHVYIMGTDIKGNDAITAARKALCEGQIVAVKGIGGYHLACDATSEEAVSRLRMLKNRPMKPFAVMMKDLATVKRECVLTETDVAAGNRDWDDTGAGNQKLEMLTGHQKPIILLEKKEGSTLAEAVAPDNPKLGVMLPYTPVHLLLFDYEDEYQVPDCLVMTSANASGAPICRTDEDAASEIMGFTDLVLSNNRMIRTRADDTVMDFYHGSPYMIRRSRGFAPLPVMISSEKKGTVLAVGGELKNTFCIAKNNLLYPSAYVGDMADIRTVNALEEAIQRMETLLEISPSLVVADLHPKYNTTAVAESLGLPVLKIQHHYAHILSCMAENDYLDEVIGVSFDGTGYGTDGTIWGGEYLRCSVNGFERLGSISPFIQCGGDLSSKEGWRIAASILGSFAGPDDSPLSFNKSTITDELGLCSDMEYDMLSQMAHAGINSITSTSAGRLFDAVSAILGIRRSSTFEGEAATALMFSARRYAKECGASDASQIMKLPPYLQDVYNTNDLVKEIAHGRLSGLPADQLALVFHRALATMITEEVVRYSQETGIKTAALSGGVFQNTLLLELVEALLSRNDIRVLRHSLIPPNDGGICVGQALAGLAYIKENGIE